MRATIIMWWSNGIYQRPQTSMLHIGARDIHMDSSLPQSMNIHRLCACVCICLCLFIRSLYMNIQHLCVFFWSKWRPWLFGVGGNVHLKTCICYFVSLFNLHLFQSFWSEGTRRRTKSFLKNNSYWVLFWGAMKPHTFFERKKKRLKDFNL